MNWRISLVVRRAITMLPALIVLAAGVNTTEALVLSQIVLSFGIPFALFPLIVITRDPAIMGEMVNQKVTTVAVTIVAIIIAGLNIYLLYDAFSGFLS
jgi:manganese transport protein